MGKKIIMTEGQFKMIARKMMNENFDIPNENTYQYCAQRLRQMAEMVETMPEATKTVINRIIESANEEGVGLQFNSMEDEGDEKVIYFYIYKTPFPLLQNPNGNMDETWDQLESIFYDFTERDIFGDDYHFTDFSINIALDCRSVKFELTPVKYLQSDYLEEIEEMF